MNSKKNITRILSPFFVLLTLLSCKGEKETKRLIRPVKVFQVEGSDEVSRRSYPAVAKESKETTLSFRVAGPLVKFNVKNEGQEIKKGELIAEVDPRDFSNDLQAKKASYEQAEAERKRFEQLLKKGTIPQNEYDIKYATAKRAYSAYRAAANALRDTKLIAPYTGYVGKKYVENYQRIQVGQPIVSLIDVSEIDIYFHVPEVLAKRYFDIKRFEVVFDNYPEKVFKASLKEIGKTQTGEGYPVTLVLDYKFGSTPKYIIAPGMSCKVKAILKNSDSEFSNLFIVPVTAVFEPDAKDYSAVWVLNPETNTVEERKVTVGNLVSSSMIEISSGVKSGDLVVTAGVHRLHDGQKVKPLK
ncbi:hemolysin D (plasmid) [Fulvitalea axinellae]|uniref:Hemolysin D n=1 Tax=Fulvitalea axinellae TaxID=1182444 RepID=A0AAU9CWZ4_9BACT|nr:hemolysin D [Fulvitalea axinellae]